MAVKKTTGEVIKKMVYINRRLSRASRSLLRVWADWLFSYYIRSLYKRCYTCGSKRNLQCGHFVSRVYLLGRYDEDNVRAQCVRCNVFKVGNKEVFSLNLVTEYGERRFCEMVRRIVYGKSPRDLRAFYVQVINRYTDKVLSLLGDRAKKRFLRLSELSKKTGKVNRESKQEKQRKVNKRGRVKDGKV
ncbi:MAG: recombination protein NinG [candidate division WOR-3 bacterium]